MNLFKGYYEFGDFIDNIASKASIVFAGFMAITVLAQVLFRYVLKNPFMWTEELARYLMIWMAFLGTSASMRTWDNVFVDYFVLKLPKKAQSGLDLVIKLIMLVTIAYLFILSIKVFPQVSAHQVTPALEINMLWPEAGIIVGLFLMLFQLIGVILKTIFKGSEN